MRVLGLCLGIYACMHAYMYVYVYTCETNVMHACIHTYTYKRKYDTQTHTHTHTQQVSNWRLFPEADLRRMSTGMLAVRPIQKAIEFFDSNLRCHKDERSFQTALKPTRVTIPCMQTLAT